VFTRDKTLTFSYDLLSDILMNSLNRQIGLADGENWLFCVFIYLISLIGLH